MQREFFKNERCDTYILLRNHDVGARSSRIEEMIDKLFKNANVDDKTLKEIKLDMSRFYKKI